MPLTKEQKTKEIAAVAEMLSGMQAVYLTNFMGLNVEQVNELRGRFHESGVQYRVVKNTLLRLALKEVGGYDALYEHLSGPTAVAFSADPSTAARVIKRFKTDTSLPLPALKAAFVGGDVYTGDQIDELAALKSKDELLGDVVGLLLSPMANVVGAVQAPGATLVTILETLQEKEDH